MLHSCIDTFDRYDHFDRRGPARCPVRVEIELLSCSKQKPREATLSPPAFLFASSQQSFVRRDALSPSKPSCEANQQASVRIYNRSSLTHAELLWRIRPMSKEIVDEALAISREIEDQLKFYRDIGFDDIGNSARATESAPVAFSIESAS